jgi:hypothetical protein
VELELSVAYNLLSRRDRYKKCSQVTSQNNIGSWDILPKEDIFKWILMRSAEKKRKK